jgi:hypothetical protein
MTDDTLNRSNCQCQYCHKTSQVPISQDLGLRHATSVQLKVLQKPVDPNTAKLRQVPHAKEKALSSKNPNLVARMSDLRSNRYFRSGEVIWCALDPPIQGEHGHSRIEFWPGLVADLRLQSNVQRRDGDSSWKVSQSYQYKVKFLALGYSEVVLQDSLLPYQAYGPSPSLIERLRAEGDPNLLNTVKNKVFQKKLRPLGADLTSYPQLSFKEAATPFALSIQISTHLLKFWTPEYEYMFLGHVPSWDKSCQSDATRKTAFNELRHEGLWWGAERIWVDEVVRLVTFRAQVLQNTTHILSPSPQSERRGVLMRLNAIITQQGPGEKERSCKVAGTLYELAREDFQEDEPNHASVPPVDHTDVSSGAGVQKFVTMHLDNLQTSSTELPVRLAPVRLAPSIPPNLATFQLPKPPPGCKLRPITPPGYEIVLDVDMIAGRYYPDILQNRFLKHILETIHEDDAGISQLRALCGLETGAINSMECYKWCQNRSTMVQVAHDTALHELVELWKPEDAPLTF